MNPFDTLKHFPSEPLPATVAGAFLPMTFLENLDIDVQGTVMITSLLDGRLWAVPFGGQPVQVAQIPGRACSVAAGPEGQWLVFGSDMANQLCVFEISPDGQAHRIVDVPGGIFPNGVQRLSTTRYLWADSITATIWEIDYETRSASVWLQHPLLAPVQGAWIPGLNGLKLSGDALYMTNSAQETVLVLDVADGRPSGEPRILASGIGTDDFAIAANGSIYLTTHPQDTILRLDPDGAITRVAGAEQGVRGCTACLFGARPGDETGLYVVTDGGLFNPASGGLEPAKLVRLETGVKGAPARLF